MSLHPFQRELRDDVRKQFADASVRAVCMQLGTGGGKTHLAAEGLILPAVAKGKRVVFAAHLDSLIEDTAGRLRKFGVPCGIVQANRPTNPLAPVQVCSLDTLHARTERPPADLVILDECHRAEARTVGEVLDSYAGAYLVGLTATPQRGDGKPLGRRFQRLVCGPSNAWLTSQGYLVPCELLAPPQKSEGLFACPVEAYQLWTPGTRAIVFASSLEHARHLREKFEAARVSAAVLSGETARPVRERQRLEIAGGLLKVIINVAVAVEGWDCPPVETVILARTFGVVGSWLQAIGRGRRTSALKTRCTVIDLPGAYALHGLPDDERRWSIEGKACVRVGESLKALRRCLACCAIFPSVRKCPRCGATAEHTTRMPRILNRAEKLERVSHLSDEDREQKAFYALRGSLIKRGKSPHQAEVIARKMLADQAEKRKAGAA